MSVITSSKYIYTLRKNNVYNENAVVELNIPMSNMLINTKDTYLVGTLKLKSTQYKLAPSQRAGLSGLIRNLTVSAGTGQVLESLNNYGFLYSIKDYYESSPSIEHRKQLHEGKPNSLRLSDTSANQYCNPKANSNVHRTVEFCLPIYLSGCLSPERDDVFPCVATKGLSLKAELTNAETALNVIKAPVYETDDDQNFATGDYDGYSSSGGYAVLADVASGGYTISLKHTADTMIEGVKRVLSANLANPAHVFQVGQYVYVKNTNGDEESHQIKSISMGEKNNIQLTFEESLSENVDEDAYVYVSTDAAHKDADYDLSNLRMNVGLVQPPPGYLDSIAKKIQKNQFSFDVKSYTDYGMNISNNSNNNSLKINCRNTRAKSIICVPQSSAANSILEDSYQSDKETPRDYNFQLYNNVVVLSKQAPLDKFNHSNKALYNAVALREMEKSLTGAGWQVNNLKNPSQQWFVGRKLANDGYTYNCNNELTLNINYVEVNALLMHNFLVHLRRITCTDTGVDVSY